MATSAATTASLQCCCHDEPQQRYATALDNTPFSASSTYACSSLWSPPVVPPATSDPISDSTVATSSDVVLLDGLCFREPAVTLPENDILACSGDKTAAIAMDGDIITFLPA
jgi:hypothetical protein